MNEIENKVHEFVQTFEFFGDAYGFYPKSHYTEIGAPIEFVDDLFEREADTPAADCTNKKCNCSNGAMCVFLRRKRVNGKFAEKIDVPYLRWNTFMSEICDIMKIQYKQFNGNGRYTRELADRLNQAKNA